MIRAFLGRFFWGLVGNDDSQVSTGAVCAVAVVGAWLWSYIWCQYHQTALKMNPAEVLLLAGGLMALPKASKF